MRVPFIDLATQYESIRQEIDESIREVFSRSEYTNSTFVRNFERAFANAHEARHCIAVNNGTSALHAVLLSLRIGAGDEVILPANTFIATAHAVSLTGARPVFVDCHPEYYTMDVEQAKAVTGPDTKAIIPVHLYGQMCAMEEIRKFSEDIPLIEDCAQSHLARRGMHFSGTMGLAGCFSFYPVKNLGAYGEGGAVLTNDNRLDQELRSIRTYGSANKYTYERLGHNYRMEELQGAILSVKLRYLEKWTNRRISLADNYTRQLSDIPGINLPGTDPENRHVFHLYVIRTTKRDELRDFLRRKGIETGLHYPLPLHLQPVHAHLGYKKGAFPHSEKLAAQSLSLPLSESLSDEQAALVIDSIREFFRA